MTLVVVMLDDPHIGGGPGTIVEVTDDPVPEILARYTDRDGARSEKLRLWRWDEAGMTKVGDRVVSRQFSRTTLRCGTGRLGGIDFKDGD